MRQAPILVTALVLIPLTNVAAQEIQWFKPGSRMRVSHSCKPACQTVVGTVVALTSDSIFLRAEDQSGVRMSLASVRRLEQSVGHSRKTQIGAGIGFLIGPPTGFFIGKAVDPPETGGCFPQLFDGGRCDLGGWPLGLAIGLVAGGAIGAVIGSLLKGPESWSKVPLGSVQASIALPRHGRFGLSMSFAF